MADPLTIKQQAEQVGVGDLVISVDSTNRSPSLILRDSGISILANNPSVGVFVEDTAINLQGSVFFSASGKSIVKGNFTENDNSYIGFTYPNLPIAGVPVPPHVHAIEPAYIYRIPPILTALKPVLSSFTDFLAA